MSTMWVRGILVFVIEALLTKAVITQCIGSPLNPAPFSYNMPYENLAPVAAVAPIVGRVVGGNLIVDTSAPDPSGVSIFSENLFIDGTVLVTGNLPFLGTVALEGLVPAIGTSAVSYECGNGNTAITSDVPIANIAPNGLAVGLGECNRLGRL